MYFVGSNSGSYFAPVTEVMQYHAILAHVIIALDCWRYMIKDMHSLSSLLCYQYFGLFSWSVHNGLTAIGKSHVVYVSSFDICGQSIFKWQNDISFPVALFGWVIEAMLPTQRLTNENATKVIVLLQSGIFWYKQVRRSIVTAWSICILVCIVGTISFYLNWFPMFRLCLD